MLRNWVFILIISISVASGSKDVADYCDELCRLDPSCNTFSYCKTGKGSGNCFGYYFKTACSHKGCFPFNSAPDKASYPVSCDDALRLVNEVKMFGPDVLMSGLPATEDTAEGETKDCSENPEKPARALEHDMITGGPVEQSIESEDGYLGDHLHGSITKGQLDELTEANSRETVGDGLTVGPAESLVEREVEAPRTKFSLELTSPVDVNMEVVDLALPSGDESEGVDKKHLELIENKEASATEIATGADPSQSSVASAENNDVTDLELQSDGSSVISYIPLGALGLFLGLMSREFLTYMISPI